MKKRFFGFFMVLALVSLLQIDVLQASAQAPGIIVVINSNTVWTKADSPHVLTGPVLVNQGITLTIEAGSTVNLNGYELRVNGTLRAIGTSSNKIFFKNGTIRFTEFSEVWDEQTGTGSILQFCIFEDVDVIEDVPVSINDNPVSDDDVWSKDESPIEFTDKVVVEENKILTIQPGVTVEMQGFDLVIKGTLRVLGSSSEKVLFKSEPYEIPTINFTSTSIGWDGQTGTGSLIDNTIIERITLASNVSLKIVNSEITFRTYVEGSSEVQDNILNIFSINGDSATVMGNSIYSLSITGGSVVCSNNHITKIVACFGSPEISNNTIGLFEGSGGSPVISGNIIEEFGRQMPENYTFDDFIKIHWVKADSPIITNNIINRGLYLDAKNPIISYNTIHGYRYNYTKREIISNCFPWYSFDTYLTTSGINIPNGGYVEGNMISGCSVGIIGATTIVQNFLIGNNYGLTVDSSALIKNNTFTENKVAIKSESSSLIEILDNVILNNTVGIENSNLSRIERNLIKNNEFGTKSGQFSNVTLQKNSYIGNLIGIEFNNPSCAVVNFNNFENNTQNNIRLVDASINIDATNNWWETTDAQAINLTIHDYKYEFGLGKVTFVPFLTESNPEAMPDENVDFSSPTIPEFSSLIVLPFVLVVVLGVMICKHKIEKRILKVHTSVRHIGLQMVVVC